MASLIQHAKRYGLAATFGYAAWRVRNRLEGYKPYTCMLLAANRQDAPPQDAIALRQVALEQLEPYVKDARYDLTERFLAEARGRGDRCVGAFERSMLVGYGFVSLAPTKIDNDFFFVVPAGCAYQYKAFVLPRWRGRRIHERLTAARRALAPEISRFVTLVMSQNRPSLSGVLKAGYQPLFEFAIAGRAGSRRLVTDDARAKVNDASDRLEFHSGSGTFQVMRAAPSL